MKKLKTFEKFVNESKKKNYTAADHKKDVRRLEDIQEKAEKMSAKRGTSVEEEMIKLAKTQANRIKNGEKAYYRGTAASKMGMKDVAKIFLDISDKLLKGEKVKESTDYDEPGLILNIDGDISKWYYVNDAIQNGILEDYCDVDDDILEDYGQYLVDNDNKYDDYVNIDDLTDMIIEDFEIELNKFFKFLNDRDEKFNIPDRISISGFDDEGDDWDLEYEQL